jgi:cobalamin biosynthesis Mg chelatase CobN
MPTDIKKLDVYGTNTEGQVAGNLSLVKAPKDQLQKADDLIEAGATLKPKLWDREARREYAKGMAKITRAKFEVVEVQIRALLEDCRIVAQAANEATRVAADTLLNRLHQAAAVQRRDFANVAYEQILELGIKRFHYILDREQELPATTVERELKRCAQELEQNLQAVDLRSLEPRRADAGVK